MKTTMTMTETKKMTNESSESNELIGTHRDWVRLYNSTSIIAHGHGSAIALTAEQKAAYQSLPSLIDNCRESWEAILVDTPGRPLHYLLCTPAPAA
jgi:hypothetical protein